MNDIERAPRGWIMAALTTSLIACAWGWFLEVRPVLAFGLVQATMLMILWRYPKIVIRRVHLERAMSAGACEEDLVRVRFHVENRGRLPFIVPQVEDRFAPDKIPVRTARVVPGLKGRHAAEISYDGRCFSKRGAPRKVPRAASPAAPDDTPASVSRATNADRAEAFTTAVSLDPPARIEPIRGLRPDLGIQPTRDA